HLHCSCSLKFLRPGPSRLGASLPPSGCGLASASASVSTTASPAHQVLSLLSSPFWLFLLSWLALSQQAPPVLNAPSSIRCLKHLHLVGCCCILGDVVPLAAILWCGSQTSTRTPHPSASWPIVMPQCVCVYWCAVFGVCSSEC